MSIELKKVEKLPERIRKVGKSKYDDIIEKFLANDEMTFAEVSKKGVKTSSLLVALRGRISKNYKGKLKVVQRQNKVYLSKDIE